MTQHGDPTLGEIVDAAQRRASGGERTHPGFGFASLAPSPLKLARAEQGPEPPNADTATEHRAPNEAPPPAGAIESRLDHAWARLKRSINPSS